MNLIRESFYSRGIQHVLMWVRDVPVNKERWVPDVLPTTRYIEDGDGGYTLDERWREHWQPRSIWNSLHTNSPAVITELEEVPYPADHVSGFWLQNTNLLTNAFNSLV